MGLIVDFLQIFIFFIFLVWSFSEKVWKNRQLKNGSGHEFFKRNFEMISNLKIMINKLIEDSLEKWNMNICSPFFLYPGPVHTFGPDQGNVATSSAPWVRGEEVEKQL